MSSTDGSNPNLIGHQIEERGEIEEHGEADLGSNPGERVEADLGNPGEIKAASNKTGRILGVIAPLMKTFVSIESVELTIKDGSSHEIYGKIMVTGRYGKVYDVYNRPAEEADIIPVGKPCTLRLSGPKRSVQSKRTYFVHVRLYEKLKGSDKPLPLLLDDIFFCQYSWDIVHKQIDMPLEGKRASLKISFCRFADSIPVKVSVSPFRKEAAAAPWRMFGTVRVLQHVRHLPHLSSELPGFPCFDTSFTLFDRDAKEAVPVCSGEAIPLDRNLIVAPVDREGQANGPSLILDVDLGLLDENGNNVNHLKYQRKFIFKERDPFSRDPIQDTINCELGSSAPDRLEINLLVAHDYWICLDEEEEESDYEELLAKIPGFPVSSMFNSNRP